MKLITKQQYDKNAAHLGNAVVDLEIISDLIDFIILQCYRLSSTTIRTVDLDKVKDIGCENEAINWGDLKCYDVKPLKDGTYIATIEEAAPDAINFQLYISAWLSKWGWDVTVKTEW